MIKNKLTYIVMLCILVTLLYITGYNIFNNGLVKTEESKSILRDFQFDIVDSTLYLYDETGINFIGDCPVNKLDSLLMSENE